MLRAAIAVACTTFVVVNACALGRFSCEDDDQCAADGVDGICEPTGACSFPDDACPSGRRYGDHGRSDLAGMCVDDGGTDTSGSTSATTTSATTTATTATTIATSLDVESSAGVTTDDTAASSEGPRVCPPGWWDCAWTRRVAISLDVANPKPLGDVPVLVRLDATRIDFDAAQDDGDDLRFVQGGVALPHELEQWNAGESAIAWVELATPAVGDLALYHGNPDAPAADDAAAIWPDPFAAVWHMSGGTFDSTANANDGIATDGVLESPGFLANAADLGAVDQRIDVAAASSLDDVMLEGGTISAWILLRTFGGTGRGRIADNTDGSAPGWMFYPSADGNTSLRYRQGYPGGQVIWTGPGNTFDFMQWYHVAVTFDALQDQQPRLYVDGIEQQVAVSQGVVLGDALSDAGHPIVIGNSEVPDRWFDGLIDELRIERTVRTPEWIALQVQSMRDELLGYGAIERLEDLQ
ncbi:MAG TPA: LamG domain-containing protein [Nannocystaceae bacterium]|nr:LamG domain-containing protein [Nannocystaceae bacterium]